MNADTTPKLSLAAKLLILLFGLLAVMMLVYSLFIRHDEQLQIAGTAIDQPFDLEQQETFGYEITAQDIRNEAMPVAVDVNTDVITEEEIPAEEVSAAEEAPQEKKPAERRPAEKPSRPADEPILQF